MLGLGGAWARDQMNLLGQGKCHFGWETLVVEHLLLILLVLSLRSAL